MKKIYCVSIADGILRGIIIWFTFTAYFSQISYSWWLLLTVAIGGILLSCGSLIYTYCVSQEKVFFRFLVGIVACIITFVGMFFLVRCPWVIREPVSADGIFVLVYFPVYIISVNLLRFVLLLITLIRKCLIKRKKNKC